MKKTELLSFCKLTQKSQKVQLNSIICEEVKQYVDYLWRLDLFLSKSLVTHGSH